ncbi:hypothetical protein Lal_00037290 [Lupinus albus]|nr:hypothetical protein Lal_00037290 [Lupinus albus]
MIGEVALAIEMGADAVDIGKTIHPHPTLGESLGMAAEVAEGHCTDLPPQRKNAGGSGVPGCSRCQPLAAIQHQRCDQAADCREAHPVTRGRLVTRGFDQPGRDQRRETAEDRRSQAVGQRETDRAHMRRHHFGQRYHGRAVVAGVEEGQPQFGRQQGQQRKGHQHRTAPHAVRQRAHDGQPAEVGQAHAEGHDETVGSRQLEHVLAEGRRVDRDEIERDGRHHHHHHARHHDLPVLGDRAHDFTKTRMTLAGQEFFRFLQRAADDEDGRHDHAADEEGDAPAPFTDLHRREPLADQIADQGGRHDGRLLAGRLPAHVKALVAGRGHLGQIDRHAAQLHPRRKALQQSPRQHQDRCSHADGGIAGHEGDQQRADGHDGQGHDEALATAYTVDVAAQDDGAQRAHQEARTEGAKGQDQRDELVVRREEGPGDVAGIEAVQEEVEHLQEVAAGHAQDGGQLGVPGGAAGCGCCGCCVHVGLSRSLLKAVLRRVTSYCSATRRIQAGRLDGRLGFR